MVVLLAAMAKNPYIFTHPRDWMSHHEDYKTENPFKTSLSDWNLPKEVINQEVDGAFEVLDL